MNPVASELVTFGYETCLRAVRLFFLIVVGAMAIRLGLAIILAKSDPKAGARPLTS